MIFFCIFVLIALAAEVHHISKVYGMSMRRLGTAWLCFPMSWGKIDYSSSSESGGGYAHVRQCGLNLKAITIWSLG